MGQDPLHKLPLSVFYFREKLLGGISRSGSYGILEFSDFPVILGSAREGNIDDDPVPIPAPAR